MSIETHYKNEVIGAVNTFIQMINQSDKWNPKGKGIIRNNWHYSIQSNNTFLAKLRINGFDEVLLFNKTEWNNLNANMLGNSKLKELYERLT
ncbi:hypothetical protein [Rossellomorea aquimaris]|uniref:Uncharacterized protein n=1 Tax=Rossellomorea aquimaris TaxID=189382 RepID=A0A366ESI9_9BACI|nr:hypothetical protein [Rossellomorea aquimaris]RBP04489.1 hypothetical protein DET59_106281 [Rossellomorea aquimaris]